MANQTNQNEILKTKSECNILAAKLLVQNTYYTSSVHCYYYAILQLMKHIILHCFTQIEIENFKQANNNRNSSSHRLIFEQIVPKMSNIDKFRFTNKFEKLKKMRKESDYEEIEINSDKTTDADMYANELVILLKKTFTV